MLTALCGCGYKGKEATPALEGRARCLSRPETLGALGGNRTQFSMNQAGKGFIKRPSVKQTVNGKLLLTQGAQPDAW